MQVELVVKLTCAPRTCCRSPAMLPTKAKTVLIAMPFSIAGRGSLGTVAAGRPPVQNGVCEKQPALHWARSLAAGTSMFTLGANYGTDLYGAKPNQRHDLSAVTDSMRPAYYSSSLKGPALI